MLNDFSLGFFPQLAGKMKVLVIPLVMIIGSLGTLVYAQSGQLPGRPVPPAAQAKQGPQTAGKKSSIEIPPPKEYTLKTKDGFELVVSYLGAPVDEEKPDAGKTTVPYIVLHDWEQSRAQTFRFAKFLQSKGNAVIVPDLRGHGASTVVAGVDKPVTYERLKRDERSLVIQDIETCKKFLVKRNNDGELNVDLLVVVAVGELAPVAAQWTVQDWSFPKRNSSGIKQAQDVKGLVLIAPRRKFGIFNISQIVRNGLFSSGTGNELPVMLVWASEDKSGGKDAKSIYGLLDRARPDVPDLDTAEARLAAKTLFKAEINGASFTGDDIISNINTVNNLWQYIETNMNKKATQNIDQRSWASRDPATLKKKKR